MSSTGFTEVTLGVEGTSLSISTLRARVFSLCFASCTFRVAHGDVLRRDFRLNSHGQALHPAVRLLVAPYQF